MATKLTEDELHKIRVEAGKKGAECRWGLKNKSLKNRIIKLLKKTIQWLQK